MPNGFKIGAFDLGEQFLKPYAPSFVPLVVEAIETDTNNEPTYIDEEPSLLCSSFEIKPNSTWPPNKLLPESATTSSVEKTQTGGKVVDEQRDDITHDAQLKKGVVAVGLSASSLYLCGYSGRFLLSCVFLYNLLIFKIDLVILFCF